MIKLPDLPAKEILDVCVDSDGGESPIYGWDEDAIRAYARQAIREFVEGLEVAAWMTHHDEPMLFPTEREAACLCDDDERPIALIIKPEVDDAIE